MKYWLKSSPTFTPSFKGRVDRQNGVVKGVKMVSMGEAKGHGVHLNSDFIDGVVKLAQSHKNGVRARYGHPNMCNESLGKYLGVYKNVRREEGSAVGDLHLSKTAMNTPDGDLHGYVLDLAENEPESFGSSIVFEGADFDGQLDGKPVRFATIEKLEYTDLVGEPAATDGLFSTDSIAETVTAFLEENPQIFSTYEKKPEILEIFLNKYRMFKLSKNKKQPLRVTTFSTGEQVAHYGELEEGVEISPVELETLPDGDYTLDDGRSITVAGGVVTAVKPKDEGGQMPDMDAAMSALQEGITASLTTIITEQVTALEKKFDAKLEAMRKFKSNGEAPKSTGGVDNSGDPKSFNVHSAIGKVVNEVGKNLKQKMEA